MASHGAEVRAAAMPATVLRQHQRCNSAVFLKDNFLTEQNPWIPATQVDRQNDGHGHSPPSSMPAPHNESHGESASGVHTAWGNGHPGR